MDEVTTVSPDLQASLLCEDVRQEVNGMQTLVGIINMIPARVLPVAILKLCVWTRWSGGIGRFRQVSRILGADEEQVLASGSQSVSIADIGS